MWWSQIKAWLARIPLGVWAALAAAGTLLGLHLRGRRLEAELAGELLKRSAAEVKVTTAVNEGRAQVHRERVTEHEKRIEELEQKRVIVASLEAADQKRLAALPPEAITEEYLKLARSVPPPAPRKP